MLVVPWSSINSSKNENKMRDNNLNGLSVQCNHFEWLISVERSFRFHFDFFSIISFHTMYATMEYQWLSGRWTWQKIYRLTCHISHGCWVFFFAMKNTRRRWEPIINRSKHTLTHKIFTTHHDFIIHLFIHRIDSIRFDLIHCKFYMQTSFAGKENQHQTRLAFKCLTTSFLLAQNDLMILFKCVFSSFPSFLVVTLLRSI